MLCASLKRRGCLRRMDTCHMARSLLLFYKNYHNNIVNQLCSICFFFNFKKSMLNYNLKTFLKKYKYICLAESHCYTAEIDIANQLCFVKIIKKHDINADIYMHNRGILLSHKKE